MKRRRVIAKIKSMPIENITPDLGIELNQQFRGNCPTGHLSNSGKCFSVDRRRNVAHCFNCGGTWDMIGLYQLVTGKDFKTSVKELAEIYFGEVVSWLSDNKTTCTLKATPLDEGVDFDFNQYFYSLKLLSLEEELVKLRWDAESKSLINMQIKLDERFKNGIIETADFYRKQQLLFEELDNKYAEIDEKYTADLYQVRRKINAIRMLRNEQLKNGDGIRRNRRVRKSDKAENLI